MKNTEQKSRLKKTMKKFDATVMKAFLYEQYNKHFPNNFDSVFVLIDMEHYLKYMEYLSQFKILSRAGIFITRSETMVELLQFNKFEEFNYMNSKFLDLDEEDGSFHHNFPDFDGHNGFNQKKLKAVLEKNNFKEVESETFFYEKREINNIEKEFSLFIMVGKKNI